MKRILILSTLVVAITTLTGCMSASDHRAEVQDPSAQEMTVGLVQREIHVGMSGAEVASVLGSPNIVSTDEQRREVWVYDKVSTEVTYSKSSGGLSSLIFGGGSDVVGGAGGGINRSSGAASKTQKTLTVIIKFDENKQVRDFAYHTSKF